MTSVNFPATCLTQSDVSDSLDVTIMFVPTLKTLSTEA